MSKRFQLPESLRVFSGRPVNVWPAGVLYHGSRLLLLLGLAFLVHLVFPVAPAMHFPALERGVVAPEDVIAKVGFNIYKTEAELEREREAAAAAVPPVFSYEPTAVDSMLRRVGRFMSWTDNVASSDLDGVELKEALRSLLDDYGFGVVDSAAIAALASPADRDMLTLSLETAIRAQLPVGVISTGDMEEVAEHHQQVRIIRAGTEELVEQDDLVSISRFLERATEHVPDAAPSEIADLQRLILVRFFEPSLRLSRDLTDTARERARAEVTEIKEEVLQDQRIVTAHEVVTEQELERLSAYRDHLRAVQEQDPGAGRRSAGAFLFNLFVIGAFALLLGFYRPVAYQDFRQVLVLAFFIAVVAVSAAIIARSGAAIELIPLPFAVLLVASLWDGRLALNLALIMALLLSGQTPFLGMAVLFTAMMGGAAAAFGFQVAQSRDRYWLLILIIAFAYAAAAATLGMLRTWEFAEILTSAGLGGVNALGSTLIAMGCLPLFESFTRITTDQTLLELTNQNRPLLQRLAAEAPGTYAHSISMANLAEPAARDIGANPLLTRAGAYYHDIGKLAKPQYFVENQAPGRNPHDKLKPANSVAILREHIEEGLRLADEAKLPGCVKDFIAEHHGTQHIGFFYDRALELAPEAKIDEKDFLYPGPKPRTRESGIVLLADSVESAARVLQDPTPERIEAMVDRIVDHKVDGGQLDDTPLTLGEVKRIKEQFVTVLAGMYHYRLDYPPRSGGPEPETEEAGGDAAGG